MRPIKTLIDRQDTSLAQLLPDDLSNAYGGDLRFPAPVPPHSYVVGNFVSTVDGVISFEVPGHSGGGTISGSDEADRFVMGLLRASVDAVIVGSGTVRQTSPDHLWIAESIYPQASVSYADYRQRVLKKSGRPLLAVVSAGGNLDLRRAIFHTADTRALIVTTEAGKRALASADASRLASTEVVALRDTEGLIDPSAILALLHDKYGARVVLHEGGAALFGSFVARGLVDEVFLTLAPQIAGRAAESPRPSMVAGVAFLPWTAPWFELIGVKSKHDHLYLRYRRKS